jgi:hypothetical protein
LQSLLIEGEIGLKEISCSPLGYKDCIKRTFRIPKFGNKFVEVVKALKYSLSEV